MRRDEDRNALEQGAVGLAVHPELADLVAAIGDLQPLPARLVGLAGLWTEHELPLLQECDPGPNETAALDQRRDDCAQDVVGVAAPVEDPVDRLERAGATARHRRPRTRAPALGTRPGSDRPSARRGRREPGSGGP